MTDITCTYATVMDVLGDTDTAAATAEKVINASVDTLNIFNLNIDRLTGTAGSQTAAWTSQELGAVTAVTRAVYASYYKNAANTNTSISSLSVSTADLMSNPTIWTAIKTIATELLKTQTTTIRDPPIVVTYEPVNE